MQQFVSIIIPTFNSSKHIKNTLDSVLSQTYSNWECILVDDGSEDLTETISKDYQEKDSRFQLFKRPEALPKGPSSARNYGVTQSKGEYLIFLDADDLLATTCLENRVAKFQKNQDCDFLVFQMKRFVNTPDFSKITAKIELDKNVILESFIQLHGQWPITAPIYKSSFFKKIGFNINLVVFEDLELAIKAIVLGTNFKVFDVIDSYYRNDENYKEKYNTIEVKTKMVNGFQELILSVVQIRNENTQLQFKNDSIKNHVVTSYKKIFNAIILENSKAFKKENKRILYLLTNHRFLTNKELFMFFLVDRILLPFAAIKGSGVSRIIKKMYK
ncbi:MAG: glycosyltransferase family A protein [Flavobacterium sp.]